MADSNDRVTVKNPNTGRDDTRILRRIYEPVREAILQAIGEAGELAFKDLRAEVERLTPSSMWEKSSVGWYTTTVKLDLEARGLIERIPRSSPQRLRLTPPRN